MLPTFILTRAFTISALLVGAASLTYAIPITQKRSPGTGCAAIYGCMFVDPEADTVSSSSAPVSTDSAKIIEIIEVASPQPTPVVNDLAALTPTPSSTTVVKVVEISVSKSTEDATSSLEDFLVDVIPDLVSRERQFERLN